LLDHSVATDADCRPAAVLAVVLAVVIAVVRRLVEADKDLVSVLVTVSQRGAVQTDVHWAGPGQLEVDDCDVCEDHLSVRIVLIGRKLYWRQCGGAHSRGCRRCRRWRRWRRWTIRRARGRTGATPTNTAAATGTAAITAAVAARTGTAVTEAGTVAEAGTVGSDDRCRVGDGGRATATVAGSFTAGGAAAAGVGGNSRRLDSRHQNQIR